MNSSFLKAVFLYGGTMKIKIYNNNGAVKITKEYDGKEVIMFHSLEPGKMAEVNIDIAPIAYVAKLFNIEK